LKREAIRQGEKHGVDPQAIIDESVRLMREAEDDALRDDALNESG
jgi:hypothetical protein